MKNLLKTLAVLSLLVVSSYANQKNISIQLYGAGEKLDDKSYKGAGVKYQTPESEATLEYGNDYKKASAIYKYDINTNLYIKGGLGFLERELALTNGDKDVDQVSGGVALGFSDNTNYNLETGHITSKLSGANNADGYSRISYIEALGKKEFGNFGTADITAVWKNTRVYKINYSDYSLEAGYYPTQWTNDLKISSKYESTEHDKNNYVAKLGMEYIFATSEWKPFVSVSKNVSKRTSFALVYSDNIANKNLSMRDEFENAVGTSDIVAQKVAPEVFNSKANPVNNSAPVWTQSTYNTGITVSDDTNNATTIQNLTAVTSDVNGDTITYSIVSVTPPHSNDQTAWNNSVYIENGVLKVHNLTTNDPDWDGVVSVVVKASDSSGSNNSTINFNYANFN